MKKRYAVAVASMVVLSLMLFGCGAKEPGHPDIVRYELIAQGVIQQATIRLLEEYPESKRLVRDIAYSLNLFGQQMDGDSVRGMLVPLVQKHIEKLDDLKPAEKLLLIQIAMIAENEIAVLLDQHRLSEELPPLVRMYVIKVSDWVLEVVEFVP